MADFRFGWAESSLHVLCASSEQIQKKCEIVAQTNLPDVRTLKDNRLGCDLDDEYRS